MSKPQRLLSRIIEIAEMKQPPAGELLEEYDSALRELYARITDRNQCPVVTGLGHKDAWTRNDTDRWTLNPDAKPFVLPPGRRDPIKRLETTDGILAIQSVSETQFKPPFEIVEYTPRGDVRRRCALPSVPPPGTYDLVKSVDRRRGSVGQIGQIVVSCYPSNSALAIYGWYAHRDRPRDEEMIKISVNLADCHATLPPGYFWLTCWAGNGSLARELAVAGVVVMVKDPPPADDRYGLVPAAYIDWRKVRDIPLISLRANADHEDKRREVPSPPGGTP